MRMRSLTFIGRGGRAFARCGGFSLLEVLCAVAILAIALVGLTQGLTTALHNNKDSELQSNAILFASGLIETLRAEGGLTDGTTDGPCESGLSQCEWQQTIAPANIQGLHEVTVSVRLTSSGKNVCELKTLLFEVPTDLAPAARPGKESRNKPKNRTRQS